MKALGVLLLLNFVFEKENIAAGQVSNPWDTYKKFFDFPEYHGAGIYHDLGGVVEDEKKKSPQEYYRFPTGKCPVFNKFVYAKTTQIEPFPATEEAFLENLKKGNRFKNSSADTILFPAKDLSKYADEYKNLEPIITADSIFECAQHANKFELRVEATTNISNCSNKTDTCLKFPFRYDVDTKNCNITTILWQEQIDETTKNVNYFPTKYGEDKTTVFGSSYIEQDWNTYCPEKAIKGAAFGMWQNDKCEPIVDKDNEFINKNVLDCPVSFFNAGPSDGYELSKGKQLNTVNDVSQGIGINWMNWNGREFQLIKTKPNCLYNSNNSVALTSVANFLFSELELPPCFSGSENWVIDFMCTSTMEKFTCNSSGEWVTASGKKHTDCSTTNS